MNKPNPTRTGAYAVVSSLRTKARFALAGFAAILFSVSAISVRAQSVTLLATNMNVYAGANYSWAYTNNQLRAAVSSISAANPVVLSVSGAPAGATIVFSTNGYATTFPSLTFSNSWNIFYRVAVTNVSPGVYPLTFSASGGASANTTVNLIVGTLWTNLNSANVNWSSAGNWTGGTAPGVNDDVMFQDAGLNTNYVDASVTVSSLSYIRNINNTNHFTTIAPGAVLSVTGTNGFLANVDSVTANSKNTSVNIAGAGGTLVVSNDVANFIVASDSTAGAGNGTFLTMTNLDNFSANVYRVGFGDASLANRGGADAAQMVNVSLAKTNVIRSLFAGNYSGAIVTNSIQCFFNGDPFNNGSSFYVVNLGLSNVIQADSFGAALTKAGSANNTVRFNPIFTNQGPVAVFRNVNGGRMTMFMVGVDSVGVSTNNGSNSRGGVDFTGGTVDMLVDTMWLGRNRQYLTNAGGNISAAGNLIFNGGTVDVNTLRAGYQAYTNNQIVQSTITVGGHPNRTAILQVNTNLELGYTSGDDPSSPPTTPQSILGFGRVVINTNGVVRANQITVGSLSGDTITINNGGLLEVSNTVASPARPLTALTANGGGITVHINGTNTPLFISNLVANAACAINIGSLSGSYPPVISVISYQNAVTPNNWVGGTAPAGITIGVANNTLKNTIDVTLSSGTPKSLLWKGYVNNNWDTTTKNWLDLTTLIQTNFSTLDSVVFDDTGASSSINIAEDVSPLQSGVGILVTNNTLDYTFTGSGRMLGGSSLRKVGSKTLTIDSYTECGATLVEGALTNTVNGTLGSVVESAGTAFDNSGTVLGGVTTAGSVVNSGSIKGFLSLQSSAVVSNAALGQVNGALSTQTNTFLYNNGFFTGIGSAVLASNATFINAGAIANGGNNAGSLTVLGTFKDLGTPTTTLNLTALVISGGATFIPGGDGIGTTTVLNDGQSANNGRVTLLSGSTNIFKVDPSLGGQNSTRVTSGQLVLGPSQSTKAQNGGVLLITNVGATAFASGQSFTLFRNNFGGNPFNAGLNTTNSLPVMSPAVPAFGLSWDLNLVIDTGVIGIFGVPTTPTNVNFSTSFLTTISTNVPPVTNNFILSQLSWPAEYAGWTLEQQVSTLNVGLQPGETNWTRIYGSWATNSMTITNTLTTNAVFFRMVYP